jgi:transcriptional regulator with XRE-family HTH domain
MTKEGIGERIRYYRQAKNLSRLTFAERLGGVTSSLISQYERDIVTPPITRLLQIAEILEIAPEKLLPCPKNLEPSVAGKLHKRVKRAKGLVRNEDTTCFDAEDRHDEILKILKTIEAHLLGTPSPH